MHKIIPTVVVITILFLGIAIRPSVEAVQPIKIDKEPDINNAKELVAQLQVVINGILNDYGHIPIIRTLSNMIYNIIVIIWRILYCTWLAISMILCSATIVFLMIFTTYFPAYYILWMYAYIHYFDLYCFPDIKSSHTLFLNSFFKIYGIDISDISTLTGLKGESDIADRCPCMLE